MSERCGPSSHRKKSLAQGPTQAITPLLQNTGSLQFGVSAHRCSFSSSSNTPANPSRKPGKSRAPDGSRPHPTAAWASTVAEIKLSIEAKVPFGAQASSTLRCCKDDVGVSLILATIMQSRRKGLPHTVPHTLQFLTSDMLLPQ
jgi:hypothetical protein